jgi:hypothetical protein
MAGAKAHWTRAKERLFRYALKKVLVLLAQPIFGT